MLNPASIGSSQWILCFKQPTLPLLARLWFPNPSRDLILHNMITKLHKVNGYQIKWVSDLVNQVFAETADCTNTPLT